LDDGVHLAQSKWLPRSITYRYSQQEIEQTSVSMLESQERAVSTVFQG